MYLTRFTINRSRIAIGWLANPYRVHQRLRMAYTEEKRLLFRIEEKERNTVILVQSEVLPDWQAAFSDFDVLLTEPEIKKFHLNLVQGRLYRFRLLANPIVTREKKRLGLLKEEDQLAWLKRHLEGAGAELLGCQVRENGFQRSRKNPAKEGGIQTHLSVLFEGIIRVTDPGKLAVVVITGIGPAKAYGFGMLSVATYHC